MDSTTIIALAVALIAVGVFFKRRESAAQIIPEDEVRRDLVGVPHG